MDFLNTITPTQIFYLAFIILLPHCIFLCLCSIEHEVLPNGILYRARFPHVAICPSWGFKFKLYGYFSTNNQKGN